MSYHIEISDSIFDGKTEKFNPITDGIKPNATRFWRKRNCLG